MIEVGLVLVEAGIVSTKEDWMVDGIRWMKADKEATKGVGSRSHHREKSVSVLLDCISFDKDNPAGRLNILHNVAML